MPIQANKGANRTSIAQAGFFPNHIFGKFKARYNACKNFRQQFDRFFAFDFDNGVNKRTLFGFFYG